MPLLAGARIDVTDLVVPAPVSAASGTDQDVSAISVDAWTALPYPVQVDVANPHPTRALLCHVEWGAWLRTTGGDIRICPAVSGSLALSAGPGGVATGWGQIPVCSGTKTGCCGYGLLTVPVAATTATVALHVQRTGSGSSVYVSYPSLTVTPLRYL